MLKYVGLCKQTNPNSDLKVLLKILKIFKLTYLLLQNYSINLKELP